MLGRAANGVYWMNRYLERAENTARLIDVGFHLALTRSGELSAEEEWKSVLTTTGQVEAYSELYSDFSGPQVFNYLLRDKENPGSVLQMISPAPMPASCVPASPIRCGKRPTKAG